MSLLDAFIQPVTISTENYDNISNKENISTEDIVKLQDNEEKQPPLKNIPITTGNDITILDFNINCYCLTKKETNQYVIGLTWIVDYYQKNYKRALQLLNEAKEGDEIEIIINSPGGAVSTGILFLEAMMNTKATVTTTLLNYGYSMAAIIWGYGDKVNATLGNVMFHNILMGESGNVEILKDKADSSSRVAYEILSRIQKRGLLTEEELDLIFKKNKDFYLSHKEIAPRLKNLLPIEGRNNNNLSIEPAGQGVKNDE